MRVLARGIKFPPREAVRGDIPEPPEGAQLMMLYEEAGRTTFKRITKIKRIRSTTLAGTDVSSFDQVRFAEMTFLIPPKIPKKIEPLELVNSEPNRS